MSRRTLIIGGVCLALIAVVVVYMLTRERDPVAGKVAWVGAGTPFTNKPGSSLSAIPTKPGTTLGDYLLSQGKDIGV